MRVQIDLTKSVQENAVHYHELSKKAKRKLDGLAKGVVELKRKMKGASVQKAEKKLVAKKEKRWFEKFHYFRTSEGFLVVCGKDAKSNEVIVKKVMEKNDLYFHADIQGAAHTVLKTDGKKVGEVSKNEAAIFAAVFSKAWAGQVQAIDVYSASPRQVSKKAPTGESIGTGGFMVYGERAWFKKTPLGFSVGFRQADGSIEIISGPPSSVAANSDFNVKVVFGPDSKGETAKKIAAAFSKKLGKRLDITIDDIVPLLPSGGMAIE